MRLLWHSASPFVGTGYGWQTALTAPTLQWMGHDVAVSCTGGHPLAELSIHGPGGPIPVFPPGNDKFGQTVLPGHAKKWDADAIITLFDAWVFDPDKMLRPWIAYFPVDCEPMPAPETMAKAAVRVAMSRFGQLQCEAADLDCMYAPHVFSPEVTRPCDRSLAGIGDPDRYTVGMVAMNGPISHGSPPRKAFAQQFEGFAIFNRRHPDTQLYVHSTWDAGSGGVNLQDCADYMRIPKDAISFPDPYALMSGQHDAADMALMYSRFDVLLSATMGEGFGVPILEAQACGTPVITGDWTAMPEITFTGYAIPKADATPMYIPTAWPNTQWQVKPEAVADALETAYNEWRFDRAEVAAKVQHLAGLEVIPKYWPEILARIDAAKALPAVTVSNRASRRAAKRSKVPA